jgi:hypothetical protein
MARRPLGETAMTAAERQRRRREQLRQAGPTRAELIAGLVDALDKHEQDRQRLQLDSYKLFSARLVLLLDCYEGRDFDRARALIDDMQTDAKARSRQITNSDDLLCWYTIWAKLAGA